MFSHLTHLYTPADNRRLLESAFRIEVDSVIVDLEDAVAETRKSEARISLVEFLAQRRDRLPGDLWVRINSGSRGLDDARALAGQRGVSGFWMPKAEEGDELDALVETLEHEGFAGGLGVLVETAVGLRGLDHLLEHPLVTRVQLGEVDFRADLGMAPASIENDRDLDWVRGAVVVAAVAAGIHTIVAPVSTDFTDGDAFLASTRHLAALGFTGRACIHPAQLPAVVEAFAPSADEVAAAHELLDRFEANAAAGLGAYRDADGTMADAATVRRARSLTGRLADDRA